jgi:hypothetical protein
MTAEGAFLRSRRERPGGPVPWMIFPDWLEDRDDTWLRVFARAGDGRHRVCHAHKRSEKGQRWNCPLPHGSERLARLSCAAVPRNFWRTQRQPLPKPGDSSRCAGKRGTSGTPSTNSVFWGSPNTSAGLRNCPAGAS